MRLIAFLTALLIICTPPACFANLLPYEGDELESGYVTIVDDAGEIIMQTGYNVKPGDQYINEENRLYEVTAVEGTLAKARFLGTEFDIAMEASAIPAQAPADAPKLISIYHTHTDESYIPHDGKSSTPGKGSIMLVGDVFQKRLEELGYTVEHSKTIHEPHDANAYQRSRRTFVKLMENRPVALFDVHRDSAPLKAYSTTINGEPVAKVMLVVGRQNQNKATTLNYAKRIKAAADAKYKGLIRGIFIARGNYNQDLNPRAMLIEVGTQYNSFGAAERGVTLFADVVPSFLKTNQKGTASAAPAGQEAEDEYAGAGDEKSYSSDMLYIAGALVVGVAAFLFLSTGSMNEAKSKFSNFFKYEFRDLWSSRRKRK
ncbi:stage II sporulation protein P [Dendrosporobacter sp. 1207_IL3150]|uniref:stage II sporulation protein P n=1 Tax=Dendrosporobacter sp. 1207_IL3150 TaxID=3084054 RepID=UPI002FD8CABE